VTSISERPISIALLALGGQGGGVLTNWLLETAEANGYLAQSTQIAGVAQRTGATVYCIEMFPEENAAALGKEPVFTPYPIPGDVDLVIAGEMAETGRAIEKGFVTPNATTLIASSHRIYSITEKSALGDGIIDQSIVAEVASKLAKKFICFDMQAAADANDSVISSVLLGAIAASGALPFERDAFEAMIRKSGRMVDANLSGFAAGYAGAVADSRADFAKVSKTTAVEIPLAQPEGSNGELLAARINSEFPQPVRNIALHGALRALDFQDLDYALFYLRLLKDVWRSDTENGGSDRKFTLTAEVARQLALQMCYEDTIRVAELKTRKDRILGIRQQVAAQMNQPVRVIEYFHPRIEEFCDMLPAPMASFISRSERLKKMLAPFFRRGRNITTTSISGFFLLRILAKLRRFRRGTYRFHKQQELIRGWLDRIGAALAEDYEFALAMTQSIEIVRGYGETYERGLARFRDMTDAAGKVSENNRAAVVWRLFNAALADEKGQSFTKALSNLEVAR
jgi:indolepyruvate ferredoxin oxidoreductase beta subunit